MGWKEPEQAQILHGDEREPAFEFEINLTTPSESDWLLIPDKIDNISVTVSFTSGATGKIQATTDKVYNVKQGIPVAEDWPLGVIGFTTQETCYPCTAIKAIQITNGTMKVTVRIQ